MNNGTLQLCSVYDCKSEAWQNPMCFQALGQAMRSFGDAVNSSDTEFFKHSEDFTLFHLGEFDPRSGLIELLDAPAIVCLGVNVKEVVA